MSKTINLLLVENVDNCGIVGDVVKVKLGYARNYLLPRGLATTPSDELISRLAEKRAEAEKQVAALRKHRVEVISKLDGIELTMTRACNDMGHLYGSVTQQDIAAGLGEVGFAVKPREVRLAQTIKRVDHFDVSVKFDTDLEAHIKLHVVPDRELDVDEREEMEFDNEGELIEKKKGDKKRPDLPEPARADA